MMNTRGKIAGLRRDKYQTIESLLFSHQKNFSFEELMVRLFTSKKTRFPVYHHIIKHGDIFKFPAVILPLLDCIFSLLVFDYCVLL
jgi:hypothetical protein